MLRKKNVKWMNLSLAAAMMVGVAAGCSKSEDKTENTPTAAPTTAAAQTTASPVPAKLDPIKVEFMLAVNEPKDDTQFVAKKVFKDKFNMDVSFVIDKWAAMSEKLKVQLATNELPDIISPLPDDMAKDAGAKGALVPLDEHLDKMPNFKKYLTQDPLIYTALRASDGHIYSAPQISDIMKFASVPMIRMDLVKEAGVQPPKTIKEVGEVIKAVKAKFPDKVGLFNSGKMDFLWNWGAMWNTTDGMMYDKASDKWIYAPLYGGFQEMMTDFAGFWKDGLMDKEFFTASSAQTKEIISNGKGIIWFAWGHSSTTYDDWYKATNPNDTKYDLQLLMPLTTNSAPQMRLKQEPVVNAWSSIAVSSKSKNIDRILQMIDYLYSDEGITTMQWGVKGEHYTEKDGKRAYTPNIKTTYNPTGTIDPLNILGLESSHILRVRKNDYLHPVYTQKVTDMYNRYMKEVPDLFENNYKILLTFTEAQKSKINEINANAKTLVQEAAVKFITGERPLSEFDKFKADLEKNRVRELEQIYADSYANFKKLVADAKK